MTGIIIYAVWQKGIKCIICGVEEIFLENFRILGDRVVPTDAPYLVCNSCFYVVDVPGKLQHYDHVPIRSCMHNTTHVVHLKDESVELCLKCKQVIR